MKRQNLVDIQTEFCRKCEERDGKKGIDFCLNNCDWHKKFNELYSGII